MLQVKELPNERFPQCGFNTSDRTIAYLMDNAVERVIESTLVVLDSSNHPFAKQARADWEDCKDLVKNLWRAAQHACIKSDLEKESTDA